MGINNFFQNMGFEGGRDYGLGFFDELGGGDANIRRDRRTSMRESDERKVNIAALMDNMGIAPNRRALIDMLPQNQQLSWIMGRQDQNQAAAAAAAQYQRDQAAQQASTEAFNAQFFPQPVDVGPQQEAFNAGISAPLGQGFGGNVNPMAPTSMPVSNRPDVAPMNAGPSVAPAGPMGPPQFNASPSGSPMDVPSHITQQNPMGVPVPQPSAGPDLQSITAGQRDPMIPQGMRPPVPRPMPPQPASQPIGAFPTQEVGDPNLAADRKLFSLMTARSDPNLLPQQAKWLDTLIERQQAEMGGGADGTEYGLTPQYVTDGDGNLQMVQLSKDGGARTVDLPEGMALQKGIEKLDLGTHYQWYNNLTAEPIGGLISKNLEEAAIASATGSALGTDEGADKALLASMESKLPGLQTVVRELGELSDVATYTQAGIAADILLKETGQPTSAGGLARAKYIAMVDNQILPLLKETFGPQFTVEEGKSLRATLGNPNASPEVKRAVLDAFIDQKIRTIEGLQIKTGQVPAPPEPTAAQTLKWNPTTGAFD